MTTKRTWTFASIAADLRASGENFLGPRRVCFTTRQKLRRRGNVALSLLIVAVATVLLAPDTCHAQASFQGLGDLPGGVFSSGGYGVSGDGSVVVGSGRSSLGTEAFIWDAANSMQALGDLPGGIYFSIADSASASGHVVVGASQSSLGREAFVWDMANGMQPLGDLPGGSFYSQANGISANGNIVAGVSRSSLGIEAFIWDAANGMQGLGDLPGGIYYSIATCVSADASVVVGYSRSSLGNEAFIWDAANGMQGLGELPGGSFDSYATAVSANGSAVVGFSQSSQGSEAFVSDPAGGMTSLKEVLEVDHGLDLTGWRLFQATDVSGDGRVIVGVGRNPQGFLEAFRAELGPENHGPEVTCPEALVAECVDGGAHILVDAEVFDADGDPLTIAWHVTYPDGTETTITDTVVFGDPPAPVTVELIDGQVTPTGFFFPLGNSHVDLMVSDGISDIFTCSPITITVEDTQAPVVLTLMERVEVGTDPGECFATVDLDSLGSPYAPEFADLCSPDAMADHDAPEVFLLGETLVTWTVSDGAGNTLYVIQTVVVSDTEAPTAIAPADLVIGHDPGDCVATLVDLGFPDADDNCELGNIDNDAPAVFPLGETEVTWYVSDAAGNTILLTQYVTVTNADPIADAGLDVVLECETSSGREVTLDGRLSWDPDAGDILSVHWEAVDITFDDPDSPTPVATFPLGSTTVQLTVSDQCGAVSMTDLLIIIADTTAPQIQAMVVDTPVLWPPNHKMIPIALDMLVSDECTSPADLLLSCSVDSDEPDDDTGDGAFTGDVDFADGYIWPVEIELFFNANSGRWEGNLLLRAERDGGGDGRKYSIRCAAADVSENLTFATVCVTVPHGQGGGKNK